MKTLNIEHSVNEIVWFYDSVYKIKRGRITNINLQDPLNSEESEEPELEYRIIYAAPVLKLDNGELTDKSGSYWVAASQVFKTRIQAYLGAIIHMKEDIDDALNTIKKYETFVEKKKMENAKSPENKKFKIEKGKYYKAKNGYIFYIFERHPDISGEWFIALQFVESQIFFTGNGLMIGGMIGVYINGSLAPGYDEDLTLFEEYKLSESVKAKMRGTNGVLLSESVKAEMRGPNGALWNCLTNADDKT